MTAKTKKQIALMAVVAVAASSVAAQHQGPQRGNSHPHKRRR